MEKALSAKLLKGLAKVNALEAKGKPKPKLSEDPKKARLERKMDAIGRKVAQHGQR